MTPHPSECNCSSCDRDEEKQLRRELRKLGELRRLTEKEIRALYGLTGVHHNQDYEAVNSARKTLSAVLHDIETARLGLPKGTPIPSELLGCDCDAAVTDSGHCDGCGRQVATTQQDTRPQGTPVCEAEVRLTRDEAVTLLHDADYTEHDLGDAPARTSAKDKLTRALMRRRSATPDTETTP